MQNTGSFGAATGGMSPELSEAIQRRAGGNQGGTTAQVTQGAPTFDPTTQMPQSATSMSPLGLPPQQGTPQGDMESKIIVNALNSRLKSLSKVQESGGQIQ